MELLKEHDQITGASFLGAWADDSPEWHAARQEPGIITGSMIGSICGLNRFESPATRWFKAMKMIDDTVEPNINMKIGKALEGPILDLYASENPGLTIYRTGTWQSIYEPWMRANPDALYLDENGELGLIEVKFSSYNWNGEVPRSYRAQILWYLGCLGLSKARLVGLVDSRWTEIVIDFDPIEFGWMMDKAAEFRGLMDAGTPPEWDGAENTLETARKLHPDIEDREEEVAEQLGLDLVNVACEIDELTIKLNELKSRTLDQMGKAKVGVINTSQGKFVVATRSAKKGGTPFLQIKKGK